MYADPFIVNSGLMDVNEACSFGCVMCLYRVVAGHFGDLRPTSAKEHKQPLSYVRRVQEGSSKSHETPVSDESVKASFKELQTFKSGANICVVLISSCNIKAF